MDYLWQSNIVRGQAQLDWHVGAGGRAIWAGDCNGDCFAIAARAPVGLDLMFNNPGFLEVFFEIASVVPSWSRLLVRRSKAASASASTSDRPSLAPRSGETVGVRGRELLGFVVGLELVGVDLAGAFARDRRDRVGDAPQLLGADRQRRRVVGFALGASTDAALASGAFHLAERPVQLFVRDHGAILTRSRGAPAVNRLNE